MYSNAFNASTFLQGSVDLRSGQYGVSIPLATLHSLFNEDVSRQIGLSFSMMNAADSGFGLGWGLTGLSEYSDALVNANPIISLATGETYQVYEQGENEIIFKDNKGLDLYAQRIDDRTIIIAYKNGVIETLSRVSDGNPFKLTSIQYENGESFHINYQFLGALICPDIITNAQGTPLVRFVSLNGVAIDQIYTQIAESSELKYDLTNRRNGELVELSLWSGQNAESYTTAFSYHTDFLAITQVCNPLGGIEQIIYQPNGHQVGSLTDTTYLPYVVEYVRIPGGNMPEMSYFYEYSSDHNFTGFPFNGNDPSDTEDNLHYQEGEYDYSTTEYLKNENGDVIRTHTVTYNRFHLVKEEISNENQFQTKKIIQYNQIAGKDFYSQPENLFIPTSIQITYIDPDDNSRTETMTQQSDSYGNITCTTDSAGIETCNEYYPILGEADSEVVCPAEATRKFVRYLKRSTVTGTKDDVTLTKVTEYTYSSIVTAHSLPFHAGYVVVEAKSTLDDSASVESSYYENATSIFNALLVESIETLSPEDNPLPTTTNYTRELKDGFFIASVTIKGADGVSIQTNNTLNSYTLQPISIVNEDGITETRVYDSFGRLSQCISAAGSDYEKSEYYNYVLSDISSQASRVESTNEWGVRSTTTLDGFGRPLQTFLQDDDGELLPNGSYSGTERLMSTNEYDDRGRKIKATSYDYGNGQLIYTYEESYSYDDWGMLYSTVYSDGTTKEVQVDPILMTERSVTKGASQQALSHTLKTFDAMQQVIQIDSYLADGQTLYSTTKYQYDAFGRPTFVTTPSGQTATINEYDLFNRPLSATHFDDTSFAVSYFTATQDTLPTDLTAVVGQKEISLGSQEFNGLCQLKSRTVNGSTTQYQYTTHSVPSSLINGREQTIDIAYIPELGAVNLIRAKSSGKMLSSFDFSNKATVKVPPGIALSASSGGNCSAYTYGTTGKLASVIQTIDNQSCTTLFNRWTLSGVLCDETIDGRSRSYTLDSLGRILSLVDNDITVENTVRDSFGRVTTITVKEGGTIRQKTDIDWDEFSREIGRTIYFPETSLTVNILSDYDNEHRICSKTTTVGTQSVTERFEYDNRSRLQTYSIDAGYTLTLLPLDSQGRAIIGQTFSYDPLNNLTLSIVSFSTGGIDTRTYSYNGQQLLSVTHLLSSGETQPSLTLIYDADGNVTSICLDDQESDTSGYNELNQRTSRNTEYYDYDAYGHLCKTGIQARFYHGSDVLIERDIISQASIQHLVFGKQTIAQSLPDNTFAFMGIDQHGSVLASDQTSDITLYTPFGEGRNGMLRRGFNGELIDNETGEYSLGNGTRFYNPQLGVFMSMDSLAPFGVGDINPYRYCLGDPVNNLDPSGHMGVGAIFGNIIGVIGAAAGIILAIPTGGASLTLTAAAEIMLGAVELAATATSIALDATGHEKGASIAGGIAGLTGLMSGGIGVVGTRGIPRVKCTGNTNAALRGLEKSRGPATWGGYGHGNTLGPVPWAPQGNRQAKWKRLKGKRQTFFGSRQRIYGPDQVITCSHIIEPLNKLERRDSVIKGHRDILIISGSHGDPDGDNWTNGGMRRNSLLDKEFYNQDVLKYQTSQHPQVRIIDEGGTTEQEFRNHIQNPRNHIILGYCYGRNDEALLYYMNAAPTTSYLSPYAEGSLKNQGRLNTNFIL